MIAAINAVILGGFGTAIYYNLMGIPFTIQNVVAIVPMIASVWIGAQIGYDKVAQMIQQIWGSKWK